jgi:hypothetical protein
MQWMRYSSDRLETTSWRQIGKHGFRRRMSLRAWSCLPVLYTCTLTADPILILSPHVQIATLRDWYCENRRSLRYLASNGTATFT